MIEIKDNIAHINNGKLSYALEVDEQGNLLHGYFGKPIRRYHGSGKPSYQFRGFAPFHNQGFTSYDNYPFEYPTRSRGDVRVPALEIIDANGANNATLKFKEWKSYNGKPEIPGLPSVYDSEDESETLEVTLEDEVAGIEVKLYYTVFPDIGIIAQHQTIKNVSDKSVTIENLQSASLDLPAGDYEVLTLYGSHNKEANQDRHPLHKGIQRVESRQGSSSHRHNPFIALLSPNTTEETGEVYGLNLVYSGNFIAQAEEGPLGNIRAQIGLNPNEFRWTLEPGEEFSTPEAIINYSGEGLNGMSQNFHKLYKDHLIPPEFKDAERPILLNSWEAMYFDVNLEKIKEHVDLASKLGFELYVLDDGWFRNSSKKGMGDWTVIEEKLPGGISEVADYVHDKGMKFGLWFEPEAVGKVSDLIENHPDWVLKVPGYTPTEVRHEYLLDLGRKEVQDYIVDVLDSYLSKGGIDYVKWDMNRPIMDIASVQLPADRQGEIAHRYILGLYDVLSRIRKKYPEVLIEGCASGGGRFDPGMLYFVPQNWTSDNTDAGDRIVIQEGTSLIYPPITMGSHVSASPNHQTGRETPLNTRYQVARLFNLGYELDLTKLSEEELDEIAKQIEEHKVLRPLLNDSTFYRNTTQDDNYDMWSVVSGGKDEAIAVVTQKHFDPLTNNIRFKLSGLNPDFDYYNTQNGEVFGGDELMELGFSLPRDYQDYAAQAIQFKKVEDKD